MPSLAEIRRALYGAWRFIFIDPRAVLQFDGSARGAWRSFWAAAIVLPLNALALAIPIRAIGEAPEPAPDIALNTLGTVASWAALLILVYALVRWYGRGDRYALFVCTYNWTQIPQVVAAVLIALLVAVATNLVNADSIASTPTGPALLAGLAILVARLLRVAILAYEWYVAWVSLEAGILIPIIVVLLDFALGMSILRLMAGLT
ncbi:MAG TPA: hypothetical protein VMG55_02585 [Stellaceae bacterium]|nr:hypothetical protein [Stellaceae bacterium]